MTKVTGLRFVRLLMMTKTCKISNNDKGSWTKISKIANDDKGSWTKICKISNDDQD